MKDKLAKVYVGVDISKKLLAVHLWPVDKPFEVENSQAGIRSLIKKLSSYYVEQVVCESSGGYEKCMLTKLRKRGYRTWRVDPKRIKAFIESEGMKAKTDAIDAKMIAKFASQRKCSYQPREKTKEEELLSSLVKRKSQITKMAASEKKRLLQEDDTDSKRSIARFMKQFQRETERIDKRMEQVVSCCKVLQRRNEVARSVPAIGPVTAMTLVANMPELGSITGKQAAALTGAAPYTRQSGTYRGRESIRGGRKEVRDALYMAALSASRHNKVLSVFYKRLIDNGKKPKVAVIAVMRKLIVILNAMYRKDELWLPAS